MGISPNKIVALSRATDESSNGPVCETCGAPGLTEAFCQTCAFRLVDDALSSCGQDITACLDISEGAELRTKVAQFRYDHYEICRTAEGNPWLLGYGAMGITYKAMDTHLNCPVALKIINARWLGDAKARDRFLQEARAAARLRHANIASVFHLGLGEESCFYAMEFVEGETLESLVCRMGALPVELALNIVEQSARALRLAHSHHFIHRDIKPTNIMLLDDQPHVAGGTVSVKLIDFGLVKTVIDKTVDDRVINAYFAGTPQYASPEQLRLGLADARSDIYSLGKCLEYMLTGTTASPKTMDRIDPGIVHLVESMVADDPDARPQSAADLLACVVRCNKALPVPNELGPSDASEVSRQRRWQFSLLATLFLSIAALVAIFAGVLFPHSKVSGANQITTAGPISGESRVLYAQATELYRKYDKENNERAIALYSKALALSPDYAEANAMLASAYFDRVCRYGAPKDQLDLAADAAHRAIASDARSAKAYQVLGAIRNSQGEPWEALVQVHHALELEPGSALAMCDFGLLWVCVGQPQLGLPWAMTATRLEPSKVQSWHAAAEASAELCADDQAEEFYRQCIALKPTWMPGYCGLIRLHLLQGDFSLAQADCAKAESIQTGLLLPMTLEAQIALFSGKNAEAEAIYRRLLAMRRNGFARYYGGISYLSALGYLRRQAGDLTGSQTFLDEAATLHPESEGSEDIYDLAAIRAIEGRTEDALPLLEQAVASGWNDFRATRLDPRFTSLRREPRFEDLMNGLRTHIEQLRTTATDLCSKPVDLANYPVRPPLGKNLSGVNTPNR